jgi:hypothetical protein
LVNVDDGGSVALGSIEVNPTVPEYPVAMLLATSSAVTVKLNDVPENAVAGAETAKCEAAPGSTLMRIVPEIAELAVSVTVTDCVPAVLRARL